MAVEMERKIADVARRESAVSGRESTIDQREDAVAKRERDVPKAVAKAEEVSERLYSTNLLGKGAAEEVPFEPF